LFVNYVPYYNENAIQPRSLQNTKYFSRHNNASFDRTKSLLITYMEHVEKSLWPFMSTSVYCICVLLIMYLFCNVPRNKQELNDPNQCKISYIMNLSCKPCLLAARRTKWREVLCSAETVVCNVRSANLSAGRQRHVPTGPLRKTANIHHTTYSKVYKMPKKLRDRLLSINIGSKLIYCFAVY